MALMASKKLIQNQPNAAIFADTQWEPKKVYEWLDWLEPQLSFPVHRVTRGNLREDILENTRGNRPTGGSATPPFFTLPKGMLGRQCTRDYKIDVITKQMREMMGIPKFKKFPRHTVIEQWVGISTDEAQRMKPSRLPYVITRYPLIELGMSRTDCINWMEANGYPKPPKSACIGCPYHNNEWWLDIKENSPEEWADAVEVDAAIRNGLRGTKGPLFLHEQRVPLAEVNLTKKQKITESDFGNECEGMCGN